MICLSYSRIILIRFRKENCKEQLKFHSRNLRIFKMFVGCKLFCIIWLSFSRSICGNEMVVVWSVNRIAVCLKAVHISHLTFYMHHGIGDSFWDKQLKKYSIIKTHLFRNDYTLSAMKIVLWLNIILQINLLGSTQFGMEKNSTKIKCMDSRPMILILRNMWLLL
jgi:hypothetical protein